MPKAQTPFLPLGSNERISNRGGINSRSVSPRLNKSYRQTREEYSQAGVDRQEFRELRIIENETETKEITQQTRKLDVRIKLTTETTEPFIFAEIKAT
jgi:hypothetical protein